MSSLVLQKSDIVLATSKLDRFEAIPMGLYNHRFSRMYNFVTEFDFYWTSRRYRLGRRTGLEIDLESSHFNPLENYVAGDYEEFCGVKPIPPMTTRNVVIEIIPKKHAKLAWFTYKRESRLIESLKIEHNLDNNILDCSVYRKMECYKRPDDWEKVEEEYEEINRRNKVLYEKKFYEECVRDMHPPLPRGYWNREEDEAFKVDEPMFKEFMRKVIPKVRLTRSSLSKKLPDIIFEEEKRLFIDLLHNSAGVYGISEQDIAPAILSAQNPIDFNVHAEEEPKGIKALVKKARTIF